MRSILLCVLFAAATISCSQEAVSQAPPPFDRDAALERIRQSDFRYSLGLLLGEEQTHTLPMIRQTLDDALETRFSGLADSDESFVIGDGHFHVASIGGTLVRINSFDTRYFPEDEEFEDEELQDAANRHTAWVAVDVERREEGGPTEAGAYRLAGRILRELVDDNTLVIFSATDRSIATWQADFSDDLRGPNPRAVFGDLTGEISWVEPEDPEMSAAIELARERFPEFRQAFARRGSGDSLFVVKYPFEYTGGVEHMWVQAVSIGDDVIEGTLTNEPYYVEELKAGDRVTIPVEDITDWMYRRGRNTVGGFTVELLLRRSRESEAITEPAESEQP